MDNFELFISNRLSNCLKIISEVDNAEFSVDDLIISKYNNEIIVQKRVHENAYNNKQIQSFELEYVKNKFNTLKSLSIDFSNYVNKFKTKYHLIYNYGMGTILICEELT